MNCDTAQERILNRIDETALRRDVELEAHVADCVDCRRFERMQSTLDSLLTVSLSGVEAPGRIICTLRLRVVDDSRWRLIEFAPDLLNFGGAVAIIAGVVAYLPRGYGLEPGAVALTVLVAGFLLFGRQAVEESGD